MLCPFCCCADGWTEHRVLHRGRGLLRLFLHTPTHGEAGAPSCLQKTLSQNLKFVGGEILSTILTDCFLCYYYCIAIATSSKYYTVNTYSYFSPNTRYDRRCHILQGTPFQDLFMSALEPVQHPTQSPRQHLMRYPLQ